MSPPSLHSAHGILLQSDQVKKEHTTFENPRTEIEINPIFTTENGILLQNDQINEERTTFDHF